MLNKCGSCGKEASIKLRADFNTVLEDGFYYYLGCNTKTCIGILSERVQTIGFSLSSARDKMRYDRFVQHVKEEAANEWNRINSTGKNEH